MRLREKGRFEPKFLKYNPVWKSTGNYLGVKPGPPPVGLKGEPIQIGIYPYRKGHIGGEKPRIVQRLVLDPVQWDRCLLAWKMRIEEQPVRHIHNATCLFKTTNGYTTFFKNIIYTGDYEHSGKGYKNFAPTLISHEWFDLE